MHDRAGTRIGRAGCFSPIRPPRTLPAACWAGRTTRA